VIAFSRGQMSDFSSFFCPTKLGKKAPEGKPFLLTIHQGF
jgi:hypothetical protein